MKHTFYKRVNLHDSSKRDILRHPQTYSSKLQDSFLYINMRTYTVYIYREKRGKHPEG